MIATENDRRQSVLIHSALAACLGVYAVLLAYLKTGRHGIPVSPGPASGSYWTLACIGVAQFAGAWWIGRRGLRSSRGAVGGRVRSFFLLRAAAAEAIAIFGLLAGILGAPTRQTLVLFALSLTAMIACAPTRAAWEDALRQAQSPEP